MLNRRSLLAGILASGFAPAIGHAGILMPVRAIVVPRPPRLVSLYFARFDGVETLHVDGVEVPKSDPSYPSLRGVFAPYDDAPLAWSGWTASAWTEVP